METEPDNGNGDNGDELEELPELTYPPVVTTPPPVVTRLQLALDGGPVLDLDNAELLHITEVDFGFPEVREVSDDRPLHDGTIDRTGYFGSRLITLTGKVGIDWQAWHGRPRVRQALVDALAPFLRPDRRPWLYSRFDDGRWWRILLRPDQYSRPQIANVQDIALTFKSPTGVFEDAGDGDQPTEGLREIRMIPERTVQGRRYDLVHPRVYPAGHSTVWLVENTGNAPAEWTATIFGPCIAPAVVNVTTGEQVRLEGLTLNAGQFVVVSSRDHTILADGLIGSSRWSAVDYVQTTWWQLPPGITAVRFRVGWFEIPAAMFFAWRNTNLL